ncbi:MAG: hypothetical protein WBQ73_00970, partial [Candidatus Babeliales bacterium]
TYSDPFEFLDDPALLFALSHKESLPNKREFNSKIIATILIELDAANILQEDFYLKTNPFVVRSLLDQPIIMLEPHCYNQTWHIGGNLFWNQTKELYFDKKSPFISHYLAIGSKTLIEKLETAVNLIKDFIQNFDAFPGFGELFSHFEKGTAEERTAGFMFHLSRLYNHMRFSLNTPLYYNERNFLLPTEDQAALESILELASETDQEAFTYAHLVSDGVYLGNTRLTLDWKIHENDTLLVYSGFLATLPTSVSVRRGLLGTFFDKKKHPPYFDFNTLFNLAASDNSQDIESALLMAQNFLLGALDHLAANLLTLDVESRHVGIGAYVTTETCLGSFIKQPWASDIHSHNYISLEYSFPATETRFFIEYDDLAHFNALNLNRDTASIVEDINNDSEYADEIVSFLQDQFQQKFYPFALEAQIKPRFIFRWASFISYETKRWGFNLGTDFWAQGKEVIESVSHPQTQDPITLSLPKATKPIATQSKLFGSVFFNIERPHQDWSLVLSIEQSFLTSGIGHNFGISLSLESYF